MSEDDRIAALEKRVAELESYTGYDVFQAPAGDIIAVSGPNPLRPNEGSKQLYVPVGSRTATADEPWADVDHPGT